MSQKERDCPGPCPLNACDYIVYTHADLTELHKSPPSWSTPLSKHLTKLGKNTIVVPHLLKIKNQPSFLFLYCQIGLCLNFSILHSHLPLKVGRVSFRNKMLRNVSIDCRWPVLFWWGKKKEEKKKNLKSIKDVQCTFCPSKCEGVVLWQLFIALYRQIKLVHIE